MAQKALLPLVLIFVMSEVQVNGNLLRSLTDLSASNFSSNSPVCFTKVCYDESAKVFSKLNRSIDPCDDFYEFACGKFLKKNVDAKMKDSFSTVQEQLEKQLKEILTTPITEDDIVPFRDIKTLYKACLNTDLIERRGIEPIAKVLNSIGGWPVVDGSKWKSSSWTWQAAALKAFERGFSPNFFFTIDFPKDRYDSTKRILTIDRPTFYSLEYPSYKSFSYRIPLLFGANRTRVEREMDRVSLFERALIRFAATAAERVERSKFYNPMNITTLQSSYPFVNWLEYLNQFMPQTKPLTTNDIVVVGEKNYLEQLGDLMDNTGKRTLANYAMYRVVYESYKITPEVFSAKLDKISNATVLEVLSSLRSSVCIQIIQDRFARTLGALYVRKYFDKASKAHVEQMVKNIKFQFDETLNRIDWMDESTKAAAKLKLKKMNYQIGFAEELLDDSKLVALHKRISFKINENEFYESLLSVKGAFARIPYENFCKPIDKNDWVKYVTPISVNAFYDVRGNTMKFPAAILQGDFYGDKRPNYMNYGAIGTGMGHELTHGFDTNGAQYDADGNFKNWWANETKAAFLEKAQCILDQYLTIVDPETKIQLKGYNVQAENIADNGGIKGSYRAYVRWAETNAEPRLPNLKYSPRQMFWIAAAQTWCTAYNKIRLITLIRTGSHSPSRFRINVPFANSKEFSDDFHCPLGTLMNPKKKCEVW